MNTIKIGSQEWATEDLKVTKFRNGEDIPLVTDDEEWAELTTAAYCISPKGNYFYNWYAVNDPRGLAPDGFHVPTDDEWTELIDVLGGEEVAGVAMKTEERGGNNSSGFSALPGGYRDDYHGFLGEGDYGGWWSSSAYGVNEGDYGYWWSSPADGSASAWARYFDSVNDHVGRYYYNLRYGFSVRCLKTFNTKEK